MTHLHVRVPTAESTNPEIKSCRAPYRIQKSEPGGPTELLVSDVKPRRKCQILFKLPQSKLATLLMTWQLLPNPGCSHSTGSRGRGRPCGRFAWVAIEYSGQESNIVWKEAKIVTVIVSTFKIIDFLHGFVALVGVLLYLYLIPIAIIRITWRCSCSRNASPQCSRPRWCRPGKPRGRPPAP